MRITQEALKQVADRLRREDPDYMTTMTDAECVWADYESLRTKEFNGDLDFESYWTGILSVYGLAEPEKITMSPVVYLLAGASLAGALTPEGINPTWIEEQYPTLNTPEFHAALTGSLDGLNVSKLGEVAVYALAGR